MTPTGPEQTPEPARSGPGPDLGPPDVTAGEDLGSPRLAAALAAMDVGAIGQALRHDVVVVPLLLLPDGGSQIRVFEAGPPATRPYDLCVFSSTRSFAAYVGDAEQRAVTLQSGRSLAGFPAAYADVVEHVRFDPAGPHPVVATSEDVRAILEPQPGDDDVAWLTTDQDDVVTGGGRAVAFDLRLPRQWFVIDLEDPVRRERQVEDLTKNQLRVLGDRGARRRREVRGWLGRTARAAASGHGKFLAFLLHRREDAAAAVSLVVHWYELGPALGGATHLERHTAALRDDLGPGDELAGATTPAGPFVRHVRTRRVSDAEMDRGPGVGSGQAAGGDGGVELLLVDYWLERPDGRGLVLVAFSTPHVDAREAVLLLTDDVIVQGAWLMEGEDDAGPGAGGGVATEG